jgi:hypothetical protein
VDAQHHKNGTLSKKYVVKAQMLAAKRVLVVTNGMQFRKHAVVLQISAVKPV